MLSKLAGAAFVLTAAYADDDQKAEPLFSLPTCNEPTLGNIPLQGTPGLGDGTYNFGGTIPADAAPGTTYTFEIDAEGDPTPGVNTIKGQYQIVVISKEDTHVTISGA